MAVYHVNRKKEIPVKVYKADRFLTRLIGLLGTTEPMSSGALYILPASDIHTYGMAYPIDILFLDSQGVVLKTCPVVQRNRMVKSRKSTKAVLELPAGSVEKYHIGEGDTLTISADESYQVNSRGLSHILHWPINLFLAFLWIRFVILAVQDWRMRGGPLNLGIVVHNTLLLFLFLTRRRSNDTSHRIVEWIVPIVTLALTMFLRPLPAMNVTLVSYSAVMQIVGMLCIISSLMSLGRSFGIVPANRTIKSSGVYKIVRHPLYTSELIFYFGFLLGNPSLWNSLLIFLILAGQIWRSLVEEKLLFKDPSYRSYMDKVWYRFIPGLY